MDYSKIDKDIKEDIVERIAEAVVYLEGVLMFRSHLIDETTQDRLFKIRLILVKLGKDLGGHILIQD